MSIKVKANVCPYGKKNGWKSELTGQIFATFFLLGLGVAFLAYATFGEPKYSKKMENPPIPARTAAYLFGAILVLPGIYSAWLSRKIFRERNRVEAKEFTLHDVVSYEVLDAERES